MWSCSRNSEWGRTTEGQPMLASPFAGLALGFLLFLLNAAGLALAFDLALALGAALGL